jgi:hypothetical protein
MTSTDFPHIAVSLSLGRTRATSQVVGVSLLVPQGAIFPTPMASGASDTAGTSATVPVNDLPREVLKVEKFEGRKADRRYCASWLSRVERVHSLLGYGDNEDTKKLAFASASLPVTSAAGQWYDSQLNTPETSFSTWSAFRSRFLKRFGPTPADLLRFEQSFQRLTQNNDPVSEFIQRIDKERDFLAAHGRKFDDTSVRNILIAG